MSHETFIPPADVPALADLIPVDPDEITSELAGLAADLDVELFPPVTLPVPARPGWALKVRTDITLKEVNGWRKNANKDEIRGSLLTIVNATIGIVKQGAVVTLDGERLLFGSPEFQQLLKLNQVPAIECARRFIGRDGDISALAVAALSASGFGSSVEAVAEDEADPTSLPDGVRANGH